MNFSICSMQGYLHSGFPEFQLLGPRFPTMMRSFHRRRKWTGFVSKANFDFVVRSPILIGLLGFGPHIKSLEHSSSPHSAEDEKLCKDISTDFRWLSVSRMSIHKDGLAFLASSKGIHRRCCTAATTNCVLSRRVCTYPKGRATPCVPFLSHNLHQHIQSFSSNQAQGRRDQPLICVFSHK